jgi:molybdate transport system substrate-binding protein
MGTVVKLLVAVFLLMSMTGPVQAGDVNLAVAASLKEVINELTDSFAGNHQGLKFLKNYGGSGALAKQIENGAPADIFISANQEWMEYIRERKLADIGSISIFAYNILVFAGAEGRASSMQDLLKIGMIAIGSPMSVPAGEYAMQALRKAGIDKQLERKLVMAKDVRECLMYAERGEVDGAFVYRTDALRARQARILFSVPRELYPRVTYPMGLTAAGVKNGEARAFYRFLQSEEARKVLRKYGFDVR